jgi:ESS family glutamate:Na+ symporter
MLELPVFSCAFVFGLVVKRLFDATRVSKYICPQTTQRIGSLATDLLVAFGVASIKLSVIVKYAIPLLVLLVCGIIIVMAITFYFGRRLSKNHWFERTIFAWGWWTGTMAMGIALLRIVDPKSTSKAMDDYALAYLPIAPLEIALITLMPILITNGMALWLSLGCLALAAVTILVAWRMKWFIKN